MLNAVNNLSTSDLQDIDTRAAGAKDKLLILTDLKTQIHGIKIKMTVPSIVVVNLFTRQRNKL